MADICNGCAFSRVHPSEAVRENYIFCAQWVETNYKFHTCDYFQYQNLDYDKVQLQFLSDIQRLNYNRKAQIELFEFNRKNKLRFEGAIQLSKDTIKQNTSALRSLRGCASSASSCSGAAPAPTLFDSLQNPIKD